MSGHSTLAAFSRPGRDLLEHRGLLWLSQPHWLFGAGGLDAETKGIQERRLREP